MFRSRPLAHWPKWAADLLEVKTPSNVTPKLEPSPEGSSNINIILDLLDETRDCRGSIAECGVFKGASLVAMALHLRATGDRRHIHGFDSFQGFDDKVAFDVELGGAPNSERRVGGFSGTSVNHVRTKLRWFGISSLVTLHPGYFSETLIKSADETFSFVHLDCDIYESYREALEFFYPRLSPGGIVLFDEYNDPPWPGCNLAVDEFAAANSLSVDRICRDNYEKFLIRKSN
jgi:hypothetical protein